MNTLHPKKLLLTLMVSANVMLASARAVTVPDGFVSTPIVSNLSQPTSMAFAPDGRLFISEQSGKVRIFKNGTLLQTPFISLPIQSFGERCVSGIAFDPNFNANPYVYLYYTASSPQIHNRVSRFKANGDVATSGETILLSLPYDDCRMRNGGALHFGPDGKLYVGVGDHENAPQALSLTSLFGKILRINRDGTIPSDNPFIASTSGMHRAIWALGLRNPFTFGIHPQSGRVLINDVGQNGWEEINEGAAGANFGWPDSEGATEQSGVTPPLYTYARGSDGSCALTGGAFYEPSTQQFPSDYLGNYFFADFCGGWIKRFNFSGAGNISTFASGLESPIDLRFGPEGALYYLTRGTGTESGAVGKISFSPNVPPSIVAEPQDQTISVGQSAVFSVQASGSDPLTFQWFENGNPLDGANSPTCSVPEVSMDQDGSLFQCVISNPHGDVSTREALLAVIPNTPPTGTFMNPSPDTLFEAGRVVKFSMSGSDSEDGILPASAFTWRIDMHHDDHVHPFIPTKTGTKNGSFTIPRKGMSSAHGFYRIHLTVKDSDGAKTSIYHDVHAVKSTVTVDTSPSGIPIKVDGLPLSTPSEIFEAVNYVVKLEAPLEVEEDGTSWRFTTWSNGKPSVHNLIMPASESSLTAIYRAVGSGDGLFVTYFDDPDFLNESLSQVEPTVNLNISPGSHAASLRSGGFGVRWTGQIQPQFSGEYTLYVQTAGGVRLTLDGAVLIEQMEEPSFMKVWKGKVHFTAGEKHQLQIEYRENTGPAGLKLLWSSTSTPKKLVPQSQLYSEQ